MAEVVDNTLRKSRRNKAPGAFRTISEVANILEVPQHVLRFWESKFSQIKPLKRGGGRRYYRPEDVDLLRGIRHLLYTDGYTIKGVQKLLREIGVKSIMETGKVLSGGRASSAVDLVGTKSRSKRGLPFQEIVNTSPEPTLTSVAEADKSQTIDQVQNISLTPLQRVKLEELAAELDVLRDILREARKG